MKSFWLIPLVLVFAIALSPAPMPAFACSTGAAETIQFNVSYADLIVKAHVVESDDLQTNTIIQVESYLAGTPAGEYLFIRTHDPFEANLEIEGRGNPADCSGFRTIPTTKSVYFLLKFRSAGIYFVYRTYGFIENEPRSFPVPDPNNPDGAVDAEFSEPEFVTLVTDIRGRNPQPPTTADTIYPAKSLLAILTSTGQQYYLPVDGTAPVEIDLEGLSNERIIQSTRGPNPLLVLSACWLPANCPELSPDRLAVVQVSDDRSTVTVNRYRENPLTGQAFLYAPTSDRIAIWNNDQIILHPFYSPRFGSTLYEQSRSTVNIDLNLGEDSDIEVPLPSAAWSPDGRWFAYSDLDGLWLKNVIAFDSPARLLLPTENDQIPTARYFSPQSHYLAYTQGEQRATLDINSGEQFPDGVVSPDDRTLLAFDLEQNSPEIQICVFETGSCEISSYENYTYLPYEDTNEGYYVPLTDIKDVSWATKYQYLIFACKEDDPSLCGLSFYSYVYGRYYGGQSAIALDYAYQASSDEIAYLIEGSRVIWNDQERDLSTYIDGEIIDIQWMSPEFYYEP